MERRIDEILGGARAAGKTVLAPFLCAGFPETESLEPMLGVCERAGAPLAFLAMPHSPAILEGAETARALRETAHRGAALDAIFEQTRRARAVGAISGKFGLIISASASMVHRATDRSSNAAGPVAFMRRAKAAGFDGVLVPDAPVEEVGPFRVAADSVGLQLALAVAAAAPSARMGEIAKVATACVVGVARTAADMAPGCARFRQVSPLALLWGMEAATVAHVRSATEHGDGVIIAGALIRRVRGTSGRDAGARAEELLRELSAGLMPARVVGGAA